MSDVFPDPRQQFLDTDPRALRDPLQLTQSEQAEITQIHKSPHLLTVAGGLGASYLVYRKVMSRRIGEEVAKAPVGSLKSRLLLNTVSVLWNAFVPRWVSMTAPYLLTGYVEGMRDARAGTVPDNYLEALARDYSEQLGHHINDASLESLLSGFQAQVNRKVPPMMAAKRTADAYGVTRRGMNALVNVWTAEEPKKFTDRVLPNAKEERVAFMVAQHNKLRAKQIGDNEEWAAHTQSKQVVWMYGVNKGVIPSSARRVWITAADERVCKVCGPMDSKVATVGEKFTLPGKTEVWCPPTHVNCRCDMVLDLNVTDDMQDELTALLAEEADKVDKALGKDPFDRDKSGRFAPRESRQAQTARAYKMTPLNQEPTLEQRRKKFLAQRKAAREKPKPADLFGKKPELFSGQSDLLRGTGGLFIGENLFAEPEQAAPTSDLFSGEKTKTPDPGRSQELFSSVVGHDLFKMSEPFQQQRNALFESKLDLFMTQAPHLSGVPDLPPDTGWQKGPVPYVTLLRPRHAGGRYMGEYEGDDPTQYDDDELSLGPGEARDLKVKRTNDFFEWYPEKGEAHPITGKIKAYWLTAISAEVTAYIVDNDPVVISDSKGKRYIVTPEAYSTVLQAMVFDYTQDQHHKVFLPPVGGQDFDQVDEGEPKEFDAADLAQMISSRGWNPEEWVEANKPALFTTEYISETDSVQQPNVGNTDKWDKGNWKNPGLYKTVDLTDDFDSTMAGAPKGAVGYFSSMPVKFLHGVPVPVDAQEGLSGLKDVDARLDAERDPDFHKPF